MKNSIVRNNSLLLNIVYATFSVFLIASSFSCVKLNDLESERQDFTLDLPSISAITLDFPATVILQYGAEQSIRINAQLEVFDLITKEVSGGKWEIDLPYGNYNYEPVTIYLTLPTISSLETTSTGDIITSNVFPKREQLEIATRSTGDISYKGDTEELKVWVDGTGSIDLEGATTSFAARIESTGDVNAFNLSTIETAIDSKSTGDVFVTVEELLSVSIASTGDVHYKGFPALRSIVSGAGDLVDAN